jgi:hypothetical protein
MDILWKTSSLSSTCRNQDAQACASPVFVRAIRITHSQAAQRGGPMAKRVACIFIRCGISARGLMPKATAGELGTSEKRA